MGLLNTLSFITSQPLTKDRKASAIARFIKWQIGSRSIYKKGAVIKFVDEAKLFVKPGMTGATGNIYVGLHEFEDMAFVLHYLRATDFFVDVGANIGSYTVLASKVCGATSLAIEPIPDSYSALLRNIELNSIDHLVDAKNMGIGKEESTLTFTTDLDTVNHILPEGSEYAGSVTQVPVLSLDQLLLDHFSQVIKIDVEGYETEVIQGSKGVLSNRKLNVVIMETNGSGVRYGYDNDVLHHSVLAAGFDSYNYDPMGRDIISLNGGRHQTGNTIYIRDLRLAVERVSKSKSRIVLGKAI